MQKLTALAIAAVFSISFVSHGAAASANPRVKIETTKGTIVVELLPKSAPKTVANFIHYVNNGFYDGTIFHRVIKNFMIQGGGFTKDMTEKPTKAPVVNEADNGLRNDIGTLAMARTGDPNSATAQFFINVKDNAFLNFRSKDVQGWGYCVFGKVVSGMPVVTAMENEPTANSGMFQDVPVTPIVITKASLIAAPSSKPKAEPASADSSAAKTK